MKRIFWVVLGAALLTAGCADPVAPSTPVPAAPTTTDTFSDTLLVLGSNTHQFTVTVVGGVKISLASVQPGAAVGLGIGTPSSGNCSVISSIETVAGPSVQLSGTATVPGAYCVLIYDLGNLVEPAVYTINVFHS
ncbi:MAG TPA: hypothetical protein VKI43_18710 [Vicinamibacterales bacterium]|nr:hypothetical protein [Vicinamibacterales bacterium]